VPGGSPRCNFHDMNKRYLIGASLLPMYGEMWWAILEAILPSLAPSIWKIFDGVKDEEGVDRALGKTFQRHVTLFIYDYSHYSI
jgi:hypothetical protein